MLFPICFGSPSQEYEKSGVKRILCARDKVIMVIVTKEPPGLQVCISPLYNNKEGIMIPVMGNAKAAIRLPPSIRDLLKIFMNAEMPNSLTSDA